MINDECFLNIFIGRMASYTFSGIPGPLELTGPRLQPS